MADKNTKTAGIPMESPTNKFMAKWADLKRRKEPWNEMFQQVAEHLLTRKASFTDTLTPGEFLYKNVFDNTGEYALMQAASVYTAMLWPDSSRTFRVKSVPELVDGAGVEEYFNFCTNQLQRYFDLPAAGFLTALQEFEIDMQGFGNAGLGAFDGPSERLPIVFEAWNIKGMCISENAQGFVDRIYYEDPKTIRQVVEDYSLENVHPEVREMYAAGKYDEPIAVLKIIEPRPMNERQIIDKDGVVMGMKGGILGMEVRTVHIDLKHKHIMRESGYEEMPVRVGRAIKTIGEEYGRSNGMTALPAVKSLNALNEAIIVATEKQLDPPLGLLDSGRLGGGVIDTSAGALNVFDNSGRMTGEKPVFALYTVGELQSAEKLKEAFKQDITQAFGLDRLLDLNNETQMTAFETSVRNRMRGESMGGNFSRQKSEVFTPLIQRGFNILYRKGLMGVVDSGITAAIRKAWGKILGKPVMVVPKIVQDAIAEGLDVYEVEYISPAERFMQSEKLQGIFTAAEFFQKMATVPGCEDMLDVIELDDMARNVLTYSGSPSTMKRTLEAIKSIRKGRTEARAQQAKMEQLQQGAEAARNIGQTVQSFQGGAGGGAK